MTNKLNQGENYSTLVIHSTDNSFVFGYRKNNDLESDELFIKKFDNDLCNNLINDLNKFCLLYTSDAADDSLRVDLGGRRIIKKNSYYFSFFI